MPHHRPTSSNRNGITVKEIIFKFWKLTDIDQAKRIDPNEINPGDYVEGFWQDVDMVNQQVPPVAFNGVTYYLDGGLRVGPYVIRSGMRSLTITKHEAPHVVDRSVVIETSGNRYVKGLDGTWYRAGMCNPTHVEVLKDIVGNDPSTKFWMANAHVRA